MIIRLGPLPHDGAVRWTADTLELLRVLGDSPLLPFALPREEVAAMTRILEAMHERARTSAEFVWECETTLEELKPILTYWLNIGRLSDETVAASGGRWSSEAGEEFHTGVLASLIDQIETVDATYAERLRSAWRQPVELRGRLR